MLHNNSLQRATHRVTYIPARQMGRPSCPRWDLRLTRARIFGEYIDPKVPGCWQIEDHRDLDPTHGRFIGRAEDRFYPSGSGGDGCPDQILNRTLPQYTPHEFYTRTQMPWNENALYGKQLAEKTFMGTTVPYGYTLYKELQRAGRNDRKLHPYFRYPVTSGYTNPPKRFKPIPDPAPIKGPETKGGNARNSSVPFRKRGG